MSREIRRVPVKWKHPVVFNPHWLDQALSPFGMTRPSSRLHAADERFIGLCRDFAKAQADWETDVAEIATRTGRSWAFNVEYHLTGFKGREDEEPVVHPFYLEDEQTVTVRDLDHLHELLIDKVGGEAPNPEWYMPVFDLPEDELGWCVYETVSEGTPVTPVFATAAEVVEHLVTAGIDWDQEPWRREAAEQFVKSGSSFGSFVVIGGHVLDGAKDIDRIGSGAA